MASEPCKMAEAEPLTIQYALTRSEILRSFLRSVLESPRYLATILACAVGIAVFQLVLELSSSHSLTARDWIQALAWGIGVLILMPLLIFVLGKTAIRTLTVSRDGISTEIGRLKGQISWSKVKTVTDTSRFVLIARTNGNAFFVPHRAFSDSEQRNLFLTSVAGWTSKNLGEP
ncbi:MAG TPA: YcxB family protein [Candidatus Acidoferrales bacterium]|jgi:hypothetical protein|nr:YcxB family protein [Candidatus Acidoferrales bacterium]